MGSFTVTSPFDAISLVVRIGSVGTAISSLELLIHNKDLGPKGLLDAEVEITRSPWLVRTPVAATLAWLSTRWGALCLIAARFVAATVLIVASGNFETARFGALVVAATTLALRLRSPIGIHASGSMVMMTFTGAALGLAVGTSRSMRVALAFIAGQACLAYFVAGSRKLTNASWREGRAIPIIVSTVMWGNRREALLLRSHPGVGKVLCWSTMAGECAVPLALVVPLPWTVAILSCAGLFHLVTAVEMRLSPFVWAFASTYPAILFCSHWIQHGR